MENPSPYERGIGDVISRIEAICSSMVNDFVGGRVDGELVMVRLSQANAIEDVETGAVILGPNITRRRLAGRSALPLARLVSVLSICHGLLLSATILSQRELYYVLVTVFKDQRELNTTLHDACATLRIPRYALNIGTATRGVVAGCILIAPGNSSALVNGEFVGTTGWPVPGNAAEIDMLQLQSNASFIIVVEKFGIFQRLCEDRFFEDIPCILLCGRGYPSVTTRIMLFRMANELNIPVVGLADYNPHGLALLQTYRRGGMRSSIEAGNIVTDVRWLGLRSKHVQNLPWVSTGEPLTDRDLAVVANLRTHLSITEDPRYMAEVDAMEATGKHELQCLYGHADGLLHLSKSFLPNLLLTHDYL